ncbi:hypothetical protein LINPERHAP2_LOCUS17013 [Linum perenne]
MLNGFIAIPSRWSLISTKLSRITAPFFCARPIRCFLPSLNPSGLSQLGIRILPLISLLKINGLQVWTYPTRLETYHPSSKGGTLIRLEIFSRGRDVSLICLLRLSWWLPRTLMKSVVKMKLLFGPSLSWSFGKRRLFGCRSLGQIGRWKVIRIPDFSTWPLLKGGHSTESSV